MRTISNEELEDILVKHKKWLYDERGGERADLSETDLRKINLCGVNLSQANLSNSDLRGANLLHANLQRANLRCASLEGELANLHGAYLQGVDLQFADLRKAKLQFANLQFADLHGAYLQEANLREANLKSANLKSANLRDANVYGADLKDVYRRWLVYAGNIGSRRSETIYFADYNSVRCGCWNDYKGGTLAEFTARIDEVYPAGSKSEECQRYRTEYLSAIKMFESTREAYMRERETYLESAVEKKSNE